VELYGAEQSFASAAYTDPRNAEFVMLNGDSEILDWQNCEMINRGYLFMSEQDFRLNPDFEVCMRNKGYVLSTEYGPSYKEGVSAQAARLRGAMPPTYSSYSYP